MASAALALHQATFEPRFLADARRWTDHLARHYRSDTTVLLGMTRSDQAELLVQPRPTHDDAVPNANGIHAANQLRIAALTGSSDDHAAADRFLTDALAAAARAPMAHGSILNALDLARHGVEIVLAGPRRDRFREAARALPSLSTTLIDCPDPARLPGDHPAAAMVRLAGEGAAFICFKGRCLPPVTDPNRLAITFAAAQADLPAPA
jgi:uncharacterized protein YyaL (SSP411 family)